MAVIAAAAAADGHVPLAHVQVFSVFKAAFDAAFFAVIDGKDIGPQGRIAGKFFHMGFEIAEGNAG